MRPGLYIHAQWGPLITRGSFTRDQSDFAEFSSDSNIAPAKNTERNQDTQSEDFANFAWSRIPD